ncbi:MAG: hypothetical protein EA366_12870 [Spirulina sp. DLM2.Bin59]|nr:MAG: hypothetical protein EA366_12870 [Spirulina sp. DLM2.Bin59]
MGFKLLQRFALVVLGCLTVLFINLTMRAIAQNEVIPETSPAIGWEFVGSRTLNSATIEDREYTGQCPGQAAGSIRASFTSEQNPPAPRHRVIVRNITRGVGNNPAPFTNREYHRGLASEETVMRFGTGHSGRFLHVLPGENEFEYEILERRRPVATGQFTATIARDLRQIQRDAEWKEDRVCANSAVALGVCADIRDRQRLTCPDDRVLETHLFPNNANVITAIHNRTGRIIDFSLNNRMRQLFPGSHTQITDNFVNVQYQRADGTMQRENLTRGTRYQFYESAGQLQFGTYSQPHRGR